MYKFAKMAYFIIRFIEKFGIDDRVGGQPQIWFIPNSGELFTHKDRPDWIKDYETYSQIAIENLEKQIFDTL